MKDVKLSVKVNETMSNQLKAEATKKDITVSQVIRDAIRLYFQKEEN
jgi:hypothetical protein